MNTALSSDSSKIACVSPLLVILGPTASGKTRLAVHVASRLNGEIVSADSRQVYKGMDIGTGKDLEEYMLNGTRIPFHLIDIVNAGEKYNVSRFQHDFAEAVKDVVGRKKVLVMCGGTGLYIESVLAGFAYTEIPVDIELRSTLEGLTTEELNTEFFKDPSDYHEIADTSTRKRLIRAIEIGRFLKNNPDVGEKLKKTAASYEYVCFGLNPAVEVRRARISRRLKDRLDNGLIDEVKQLLESGLSADQLIYYGLEYKYVTQYLTGVLGLDEMKKKLETEIHRFAKRQMTFFRKMEKDGIRINWLRPDMDLEGHVDEVVVLYELEKRKIVNE